MAKIMALRDRSEQLDEMSGAGEMQREILSKYIHPQWLTLSPGG